MIEGHFGSWVATGALTLALLLAGCGPVDRADRFPTATPIKHLVVIFQENVSFDHYFGTYPKAANPPGEPRFTAAPGTPTVDGLRGSLLTHNPNDTNPLDGPDASNPFRLDRTEAATADQDHNYAIEQLAYDRGTADLFPEYTGAGTLGAVGAFGTSALVMGYYDGNTVTALWNYAQHFALDDNAYTDQYGPSTPGALDLISGQTNGVAPLKPSSSLYYVSDGEGGYTLINDVDPAGDVCSDSLGERVSMKGRNIGDLLDSARISWGWFEGGFDLTVKNANGSTGCARSTTSRFTGTSLDYIPHHEPFQYYASTANPTHARPSSVALIGTSADGAHHQYDLHDFFDAMRAGNFPAVSFLKASAYQDGHAGYSDPLDGQTFLVEVINFLEQRPEWRSTAVIVLYDDSDGWYDHRFTPVRNASFDSLRDRLDGLGRCGVPGVTPQLGGIANKGPVNGRCGPGTRIPLLVISPWARENFVDHTLITQASVTKFIEDNWLNGTRLGGGSFDATTGRIQGMFDFAARGADKPLFLDDTLGTPVAAPSGRLPH